MAWNLFEYSTMYIAMIQMYYIGIDYWILILITIVDDDCYTAELFIYYYNVGLALWRNRDENNWNWWE